MGDIPREEMIMGWWRRIFIRLFSRQEKDGELPAHVDLWIRELIDEGIDPRAAREEALRCFGLEGSAEPEPAREDD